MIERLFIILLFTALSLGVYVAFKAVHMQRMGHVVTNFGQPTLLYFRSDNCPPCATQASYLEQLQQKWQGNLTIQKIDTDAEPDKARQYGVFTLPTTILVDPIGQVRQVNYGLTNVQKLSQQLSTL
jgi:thioredoxin-like negative regulator of GroEL